MKVPVGHVLAQHSWRTDLSGEPLVKVFTQRVWDRIPPIIGSDPQGGTNQVNIPKSGWVKIDPKSLVKPEAAKEAEAKSQESESSDDKIERLASKSKK